MGIFNKIMGFKTPVQEPIQQPIQTTSKMLQLHYGHNFGIGEDLTENWVDTEARTRYVMFGLDNYRPYQISALYNKSSLHNALVNLKADTLYGKGYNIEYSKLDTTNCNQPISRSIFEKFIKTNIKILITDYIIHQRVYCLMKFDDEHNLVKLTYLKPEQVRHSATENFDTFDFDSVWIARDWTISNNCKQLPLYSLINKRDKEQVMMMQIKTTNSAYYSQPAYLSASNAIYLQGDIQLFERSYLDNSINPGLIISFPNELNDDSVKSLQSQIKQNRGAKNNGKLLILESTIPEFSPQITSVTPNTSAGLFKDVIPANQEDLFTVHQVPPLVLGIKAGSSLGNSNELKNAWAIFNQTFYNAYINEFTDYLNDLMNACKIDGTISMEQNTIEFVGDEKTI